jgi:hypothetical protein
MWSLIMTNSMVWCLLPPSIYYNIDLPKPHIESWQTALSWPVSKFQMMQSNAIGHSVWCVGPLHQTLSPQKFIIIFCLNRQAPWQTFERDTYKVVNYSVWYIVFGALGKCASFAFINLVILFCNIPLGTKVCRIYIGIKNVKNSIWCVHHLKFLTLCYHGHCHCVLILSSVDKQRSKPSK